MLLQRAGASLDLRTSSLHGHRFGRSSKSSCAAKTMMSFWGNHQGVDTRYHIYIYMHIPFLGLPVPPEKMAMVGVWGVESLSEMGQEPYRLLLREREVSPHLPHRSSAIRPGRVWTAPGPFQGTLALKDLKESIGVLTKVSRGTSDRDPGREKRSMMVHESIPVPTGRKWNSPHGKRTPRPFKT